MKTLTCAFFFVAGMAWSPAVFAQSPLSPDVAWSGWARCELKVGPSGGYVHHEVHTWTLSGSKPTSSGSGATHPATWSVSGGGELVIAITGVIGVGPNDMNAHFWTTNVAATDAPLGIHIRASDGLLVIDATPHAQRRVSGGDGWRILGDPINPISSSQFGFDVVEWPFPTIAQPPTSSRISGSSAKTQSAQLTPQQPATLQVTANCSWDFAPGATVSGPAPVAGPVFTNAAIAQWLAGRAPAGTSIATARTTTASTPPPATATLAQPPSTSVTRAPQPRTVGPPQTQAPGASQGTAGSIQVPPGTTVTFPPGTAGGGSSIPLPPGTTIVLPPGATLNALSPAATPPNLAGPSVPPGWAGYMQCTLNASAAGYQEQQTHTWQLTPGGELPNQQWSAVWTVQGTGSRQVPSSTGTIVTENWTITVPDTSAPLRISQRPGGAQVEIRSTHGLLVAQSAISVVSSSGQQSMYSLQEWGFPIVDGPITNPTISGTRTQKLATGNGWRKPPTVWTEETCTWNFARGNPASTSSIAPPPAPATASIAIPPATTLTRAPGSPGTNVAATPPPSTGQPPAGGSSGSTPATPPQMTMVSVPGLLNLPTFTPGTNAGSPAPGTNSTGSNVPGASAAPPATGRGARTIPSTPGLGSTATGGSTPTSSSAPSAPASGSYLVTITGLLTGQPTRDSPAMGIDPDGKGDEAYAAAYVRRFDRRTFQMVETSVRQSLPYGDVSGYGTSRLQGGTQTPTGGIRAGDQIPANLSPARVFPAGDSAFPLKVWEGRLADGVDVLLVSPSIWEYDGGTSILAEWVQSQSVLNNTIATDGAVQGRIASRAFGAAEVGVLVPRLPDLPQLIINGQQDRPVGLRESAGFPQSTFALPHTMIVLTREIIEQTLASQWPRVQLSVVPGVTVDIPKPGILVLNFTDQGSRSGGAAYSMILQVEKLSD